MTAPDPTAGGEACEVHVPGRDQPSPWCAACRMHSPASPPAVTASTGMSEDVEALVAGRPLPARFRSCLMCGSSVLMTYRTEGDPEGTPVEHDCTPRTLEADMEALAALLHPHVCAAMFAHYGPAKKCERIAKEIISDWLAAREAAARAEERERIAQAIEATHPRRDWVWPDDQEFAARIARKVRP